jgi:superfamily I DNA/RNA helicase
VTISTLHSVKGLDFACGFLVGFDFLEPGPHWPQEQLASLTCVAITRARPLILKVWGSWDGALRDRGRLPQALSLALALAPRKMAHPSPTSWARPAAAR